MPPLMTSVKYVYTWRPDSILFVIYGATMRVSYLRPTGSLDTWSATVHGQDGHGGGVSRCVAPAPVVDVRRVVDVYSQAITTSTTACYLPENTRERRDSQHAAAAARLVLAPWPHKAT